MAGGGRGARRLPTSGRPRRVLAALVLTALAGCATSGYTYIANQNLGAYLRVPADYEVFDTEQVLGEALADLPRDQAEALLERQWVVAFDAGEEPEPDRFVSQLTAPAGELSGLARVRVLNNRERLAYSLESLGNELISEQQAAQLGNRLRVLDVQEVSQEDADGLKLTFSVEAAKGTFVFDQLGFIDDHHRKVFVLALGCSSSCYEANRDAIAEIIESWTIEER